MIKLLIDFVQFLYTIAPLFASLALLSWMAILLSKSIKKYAKIYYIVFSIPFFLVAIPFLARLFGIENGFNFIQVPFLGGILRDYIHMGTLGFPLLIIIMYIGALNPKNLWVKKCLSIRKELSILSGFPVLTHSLVRVINNLPGSIQFFTNNEAYMANTRVVSELGAGISSFSFILGVVMLVIFLPLWITSFDSIHKRMGNLRWKKWQKWSYVLYATLFIHAMGIQIGGLLNPRERTMPQATTEISATAPNSRGENENRSTRLQDNRTTSDERGNRNSGQAANRSQGETARPSGGGRVQSLGFADITVSPNAKRYIHISSLILIFGSYLYLRLKKARKSSGFSKQS